MPLLSTGTYQEMRTRLPCKAQAGAYQDMILHPWCLWHDTSCCRVTCVWEENQACQLIPVLAWGHSVWARWWCKSHLQSHGVLQSQGQAMPCGHPCSFITHPPSPSPRRLMPNPKSSLGVTSLPSWVPVLVAPAPLLCRKVTATSGPHCCTHLHFRAAFPSQEFRNLK